MYPKKESWRGSSDTKQQQQPIGAPSNLRDVLAHLLTQSINDGEPAPAHGWDEAVKLRDTLTLTPQDWQRLKDVSGRLLQLLNARELACSSSGKLTACADGTPVHTPAPTAAASQPPGDLGRGHVKGKGKNKVHSIRTWDEPHADAATPNGEANRPKRSSSPRPTPKEILRQEVAGPSARAPGRQVPPRCHGGADGAGAAGAAMFQTPSHAPEDSPMLSTAAADMAPGRYPARLRSRRFPHLAGTGETPDATKPSAAAAAEGSPAVEDGEGAGNGSVDRRVSPRYAHTPSSMPIEMHRQGSGWAGTGPPRSGPGGLGLGPGAALGGGRRTDGDVAAAGAGNGHMNAPAYGQGNGHVMKTRGTPRDGRAVGTSTPGAGSSSPAPTAPSGPAATPTGSASAGDSSKLRLPPQNHRYTTRASVGGRNYTDNHLKQLGLIEAEVVANATEADHAAYNLPRQARTLTLTNIFKFVALRGAGDMYALATQKRVEEHTGRHSNFFDGKIDARVVGVVKRDIGDESITKSRKFSKILLSLIADGCTDPQCDWDFSTFTSKNIAQMQADMGETPLQQFGEGAEAFTDQPASTPAASGAVGSGGAGVGGGAGGVAGGGASKRRLDLGGKDEARAPSPRLKKLKRGRRPASVDISHNGGGGGFSARSPPSKEEDAVMAAELLQGLKGGR